MKFNERIAIGYAKSLIPLFSIIGMMQYAESKPRYAYGFAGLFVLGYIINECVFGEENE